MRIKKILATGLVSCLLLSCAAYTGTVSASPVNAVKGNTVTNGKVILGASVNMEWTFASEKEGTYTLKFTYARPWGAKKKVKTALFTVKVEKSDGTDKADVTLKANTINTVTAGQKFNVILNENVTTGYSWTYRMDSNVKLVSKKIASAASSTADDKNSDASVATLKANTVNTVKAGQKFSVILEENASTGYSWTYKADSAVKLVSDVTKSTNVTDSNGEPLCGAPSQRTWTFTADKAGTYELQFSYARSWEANSAIKSATFTVNVGNNN